MTWSPIIIDFEGEEQSLFSSSRLSNRCFGRQVFEKEAIHSGKSYCIGSVIHVRCSFGVWITPSCSPQCRLSRRYAYAALFLEQRVGIAIFLSIILLPQLHVFYTRMRLLQSATVGILRANGSVTYGLSHWLLTTKCQWLSRTVFHRGGSSSLEF